MKIETIIKGFEKLNADIAAFAKQTEEEGEVTLYEDAFTTRSVKPDFKLQKNLKLKWTEDGRNEVLEHCDEDDANETLKFWRANLRRAKKYWSMDGDDLDAIQNGDKEDVDIE